MQIEIERKYLLKGRPEFPKPGATLEDETDARTFDHLWKLTDGRRLKKRRYVVLNGDDMWEIDEFTDRPLWLAELELDHADTPVTIPDWLKPVMLRDVTDDPAYS